MANMESVLTFINYTVQKIEFYNNPECNGDNFKIKFDIDSNVKFVNNNDFLLTLYTEIFPNAKENNYPFSMTIVVTGMFTIKNEDNKTKQIFAEKNAVAILFPYIRALISTYTSASNIQPVILPPINVASYIENKKLQKNNEK